MLMRSDRGMRLPRYVPYLTLLLISLLGLSLLPIGGSAAAATWRQEAPPTTGPAGVETTEPTTTESTSTSTSTTDACATTSTDAAGTTVPCPTTTLPPSTTVGAPVEPVVDALEAVTPRRRR